MSFHTQPSRRRRRLPGVMLGVVCTASALSGGLLVQRTAHAGDDARGINPHPVQLRLPPDAPLSAVARLGKALFFDPMLSGSGRQSCASCHSPAFGYNPPNALTVQPGGAHLQQAGFRPPPSLAYLYRQPPFSIGPDVGDVDVPVDLNAVAAAVRNQPRASKAAGVAPTQTPMVG